MDVRDVGLGLLGAAFVVVGLLFLLWPGSAYIDPERWAVALLFLIPGVIWIDMVRRRADAF
jgi:hypothetical protein